MSKVFVLRTHALLSSRNSTLKFGNDNIIVIPLAVVDELRVLKHKSVEKGRIARDLLEYINSFSAQELLSKTGVKQENGSILRVTDNFNNISVQIEGLTNAEKRTLQTCLGIAQEEGKKVILVTNNLSLQLKAKSLGINAESFKDETFPRLSEQYTGREIVSVLDTVIDEFYEQGFIYPNDILGFEKIEFVDNKFFVLSSNMNSKSALGILKDGKIIKLRYYDKKPYDITPKNVGQKFMLDALMDDSCPLVVIKGNAGTGKTFCALAVGLEAQQSQKYSRILVSRSATSTEEYGFLPGELEDKLAPYLAGINDNLTILSKNSTKINSAKQYYDKNIVQIQAIGFIRGRSIIDTYFIVDETQNIDPDIIKSIVTRAGEGSKFIFMGDPTQIDNPNLNERYNGLVYLSEKFKGNPLCAQVSLLDNESVRSTLARKAAQIL